MCGIAGLATKKIINNMSILDDMLLKIRHRGPDDKGVCGIYERSMYHANNASDIKSGMQALLGFMRLSIRDLSINGHQPMVSDDERYVLTFNGEIYNVVELKTRLNSIKTEIYKSTTDTEVILKCFSAFGIHDTLRMLNGMYAIAVYDKKYNKIYVARDKVGIIPVYVLRQDDIFAWSSEIKSFLAIPAFRREINDIALSRVFLYHNPTDVIYKNVVGIKPGTYLELSLDNFEIKETSYFSLDEYLMSRYEENKDETDEFIELFRDTVSRQMVSEVPLGVQLSGGIDSSLIAYYASQIRGANGLNSFSVVNKYDDNYDEEEWMRRVVNATAVMPHYYSVDENYFIRYFEKTLYAYERPLGVLNGMGIYQFANAAKENVTVLLSGEGADEICGGYGVVRDVYYKVNKSDDALFTDEFLLNFDRQIMMYENGKSMLYHFDIGDILEERRSFINSIKGEWYQKIHMLWLKDELVCLLERQNKICMASSIENRVPFLDDKVLSFMLNLPVECLCGKREGSDNMETKLLLKNICKDIFGSDFAFRKKQALCYVISKQLKAPKFNSYLQDFIIPEMRKRGMINMKEFDRRYMRMANGQDAYAVWKAINIEAWMQVFADGRELICD